MEPTIPSTVNTANTVTTASSATLPATAASAAAVDRVAFSILVRQHHRQFLAYARALVRDEATALDLTQEALVTAFQKLATFEPSRDFPAWVRGILRNKWRELAKLRKCESLSDEVLEAIEAQHSLWQHSQQEAVEKNALFVKLEGCLGKLPEQLRSAVDSTYFESRTSEEAATRLGMNAAALRKRLERARTALRLCLEGHATQAIEAI